MARRLSRPGLDTTVAVVVLVAAAVFTGWGFLGWLSATTDSDLDRAATRDEVLRTGREHVAVLTTLDHRDVDAGIRRWLEVSTGALHEELADTDATTRKAVRDAGTVATGTVVEAALSELDPRAGTATMLASVEITTERAGSPPTPARDRFVVRLRHTEDGWKVSALDRLPAGGAR